MNIEQIKSSLGEYSPDITLLTGWCRTPIHVYSLYFHNARRLSMQYLINNET